MNKLSFGIPEISVPTKFCKVLNYKEKPVKYDTSAIKFKATSRGCRLELSLEYGEEVFGLGLQLKGFNHKETKKKYSI